MLIIPVKEGEAIERALKRFKRKFDKTGTMKQLRARQQFNKPSVVKRQQKVKAIYVQQGRGVVLPVFPIKRSPRILQGCAANTFLPAPFGGKGARGTNGE